MKFEISTRKPLQILWVLSQFGSDWRGFE